MYVNDTIVAPATPPGVGGVAIVRLSGPDAIRILRRIFHPRPPGLLKPRKLHLGEVRDPHTGAAIDRVLAVIMPGPATLTGEDVAEVQCHGGVYIVRRIVGLAMALGARMADPGEYSRRAFLNGKMDLTEAEAIADLVQARSESALAQALTQLSGALSARIERIRDKLIAIRAHLEAEIDFSDEDIILPSRERAVASIAALEDDVRILHDSFAHGRLIREGVRAPIVGKPNAGKSSILNLLLGIERAIVTPIPGTTRDVIEDSIRLGPYQLVLQDTAGVREAAGDVERIGIERTLKHAAQAELIVAVFDASRALTREDLSVIELGRGRLGVAILNKSDLPEVLSREKLCQSGVTMPVLPFCALTAEGVGALRQELFRAVEAIVAEGAGEGAAISRERHRQALAIALEALAAARAGMCSGIPPEIVAVDLAGAADALGAITGRVMSEDVLDAIFRQFCIGK